MLYYFFFSALLSFFYAALMWRYRTGWQRLAQWQLPEGFAPSTKVSILIPARNEEENILFCLQAILNQDYPAPLFEVLVIDDHSTDNTAQLVQQVPDDRVRLLSLADHVDASQVQSFKKIGIALAIQLARGELIVTTDADCWMGEQWLSLLVSFYESGKTKKNGGYQLIAAPVNFAHENSLLEQFQSLDFVGMMGITGAGIDGRFQHMCNGANLAYAKSAFEAVDGFEGIDHRASGDDMMLLQKIARQFPGQIGYLKNREATVFTYAKSTWQSFLNQRIRWASKSSDYEEKLVTFLLAMVFLFCVSMMVTVLLIPFYGWPMVCFFIFQLSLKMLFDYALLRPMTQFFNRSDLMRVFFLSVFLHWFYIVVVGSLANVKKQYEWKGRQVR